MWRDEAAHERFLIAHPLARRWRRAEEAWHVRLRSIGGHGTWNGFAVTDQLTPGDPGGRGGPVVTLTRAKVRVRAWRAFGKVARRVNAAAYHTSGLIAVVGVGEAPVGRLGTFSVWESIDSAAAFAAGDAAHQEAIGSARTDDWFSEELFARFEPYGSTGTWGGRDPIANGNAR